MSRTVSLNLREALFSEHTGEFPIWLVTITHDDLPDPIRLSSDPTERLSTDPLIYGTTSRSEVYYFVGMGILIPDEREDLAPRGRLTIENIDRSLIPLLRSTATPAQVLIEIVIASAPDDVEIAYPLLDLKNAEYDANSITIDVILDALVTEPYPAGSFDASGFPALLRRA
jgi:hypothetical protein